MFQSMCSIIRYIEPNYSWKPRINNYYYSNKNYSNLAKQVRYRLSFNIWRPCKMFVYQFSYIYIYLMMKHLFGWKHHFNTRQSDTRHFNIKSQGRVKNASVLGYNTWYKTKVPNMVQSSKQNGWNLMVIWNWVSNKKWIKSRLRKLCMVAKELLRGR